MDIAEKTRRKTKIGTVVSNKMQNTVVVRVERTLQHPTYGKVIKRTKRFYAHNEIDNVQNGDKVLIVETRPLSKLKRWRVVEKI